MIKKWLIRGDTHGNFLWMNSGALDQYNPNETAIIVLGDAGFDFYLDKSDDRRKSKVESKGFWFYCVRGNHEARASDVEGNKLIWDENVNGEVWCNPAYPRIRFFKDYGIYTIDGYKIAVIGGAYSVDKYWRLINAKIYDESDPRWFDPKVSGWFYNEQLSTEEMKMIEKELMGKTVDFVFTHTCPYSWRPTDLFLNNIDQSKVDSSMELWMEKIKDEFKWNIWLFGHYHADRMERPHVEMYYNDIEELDTIVGRWKQYDVSGKLDWWLNKSPQFDF